MIFNISDISTTVLKIILFVSAIFMLNRFLYLILGFGKRIKFSGKNIKHHKFAVLVPAKDESSVIEDLLKALANQNYSKNCIDVFVIVNDPNDKTISLTKKYGYTPLVCENQNCKGDALDYAIKYIYKNNLKYDSYLIFDADNVPTSNFVLEINKALGAGYDIGTGYRNNKDWNSSYVSSCSALVFTMVNTLTNKGRTKCDKNNIFSGTGVFVRYDVIDKYKCWPFKTLTEDYEISMYATLNNLKTCYVEEAEFYDEQPTSLKESFKQRVRWVKGYLNVGKIYTGKIFKSIFTSKRNKMSKIEQVIGAIPVAIVLASVVTYTLLHIGLSIAALVMGIGAELFFARFLITITFSYITLILMTIIMLLSEAKRIEISFSSVIKTILLNPLFMLTFIPIGLKAIFSKNVSWKKIEHNTRVDIVTIEQQKETLNEAVYESDEARETNQNT